MGRTIGVVTADHRAGVIRPGPSSLTVAGLTRRSGLPAPTVYRLVGDLVETGLLERAENREVRLGVRLWELAALSPRASGLRVAALPFMVDPSAITSC
ncbi:helix-turn-helix domain-containing protein [Kutzneria sp. NPDC051319]|uniref:helix-turn-helix domain-containing protein n=1 Tax=Kutzneria sp. NPDC051319 TaxID=3155047 RepID=UPI00342B0668